MDELLDTLTDTESIHESARVWITTEVHPKFPISLLQVCTNTLWQGVSTGSHTHVSILYNVFIVHNTYICTYVCVCDRSFYKGFTCYFGTNKRFRICFMTLYVLCVDCVTVPA